VTNDPGESRPGGDEPLATWLDALASAAPTPGGGAAGALNASLAAALVEMVCNLTIGKPAFASREQHVTAIGEAARKLRLTALAQVDDDAAAFTELMATYRLPRDSDEQRARRGAAIQAATLRASAVPLEVAATAAEVVRLAVQLPGRSNPNVLSDVGVAAACAAAALESAAINVEINLAALKDEAARATQADRLAGYLAALGQARELVSDVRREIAR
jgi:methenyltetrahydrofolate cyclohydrolase